MIAKIFVACFFCVGMAVAQGDPARAFDAKTAADRKPGTKIRIDLVGDSNQTDHAGYGLGFCANLTPLVDCVNLSKGGASTKTFRADGLWERTLLTRPNYIIITFCHNDQVTQPVQPRQVPLDEYETNLRRYVKEARSADIRPILATPLSRRLFHPDGKILVGNTLYSDVMRKVAAEMGVPLIDLEVESRAYLQKIGPDKSNRLGLIRKDAHGRPILDNIHLNYAGSYTFGRFVATGLAKAVPVLAGYVRPQAAELPPEGVRSMQVNDGGRFKIVLVGDSTVGDPDGWGAGLCAVFTPNVTCINDALPGRSSKSFLDEGAWRKALAEHADYYFIQFSRSDLPGKESSKPVDPETTFPDNLRTYIADARRVGAVPVLVTPLARRTYKNGVLVEDLKPYVEAIKHVGAEQYVTVVDLNSASTGMLKKMTQEEADRYDADPAHPDRIHLNPDAQKIFGRIVADRALGTQGELGPNILGEPK